MEIAQSLQQIQSSYIREILNATSDERVISLAGGLPDKATFPVELMKPTLEKLVDMPDVFQYGNTAGYQPLMDYLSQYYQLPNTHKVMLCTGSQQGLDLLARAYINPGDTIVMEAPSYLGAMQVFRLVQANIVTVSQTETGPDLDELETYFATLLPKLFYAVPDFHNPTGICWPLETRKHVAKLCIKYNVTLIEDAPYRELRFSGKTLSQAANFCPQHSIVLRSFSKIASPGLRLGAVTGKASYIDPMIKIKQGADLHSSTPMQALLLGLLQHKDFPLHIKRIRELYQSRYKVLLAELQEKLPESCNVTPVDGGMFVWLSLPKCNTFALAKLLLSRYVAVVPSPVFYPEEMQAKSALRLNFTNSTPEELKTAVTTLAETLTEFLQV
ncbi:GntR family transcriptional regulator [Vibrio sp. HA2012]|uniref:aminotransferase-like domain-containing protein n=1 Tax=Vibrio sp. HA2012 TaxID=1971595 RepID=UPI000C2CA2CB|nr:PLP-dependent aminotransferase family protein [Vibrio sp. HA2012]PJC87104.1 GntR family transcriptional regulator [Vibrio sp. HA2012]